MGTPIHAPTEEYTLLNHYIAFNLPGNEINRETFHPFFEEHNEPPRKLIRDGIARI